MIYVSLFIVAFTVATIIPFGSEAYFITLISLGEYNNLLLLIFVSIGNVLGSLFNWVCGDASDSGLGGEPDEHVRDRVDRLSGSPRRAELGQGVTHDRLGSPPAGGGAREEAGTEGSSGGTHDLAGHLVM